MKIAYFGHVSGQNDPGVINKIAAQVDQWRAAGHSVRLFIATRDAATPWESRLGDALVHRFEGQVSRIRTMSRLVRAVRQFKPTITYMRWDIFYPPMLWLPNLVIEINTNDVEENALGPRARSLYNAATRGILLRRARALVFVTSELSQQATFSRFANLHRVITNGIDLQAYPVLPPINQGSPRLAFVGSAVQPWQGIDKVLALAELRPDWQFDVVGMRDQTNGSPANVAWHGPLERADLVSVLATADVGLGTLALHRKGMDEASSLKVREYLALGLPVIYGNLDLDADGLGPYALRIANTETNVIDELPRIEAFVNQSRGTRVPRSTVAHIDVGRKEEQRLALFETVAGR